MFYEVIKDLFLPVVMSVFLGYIAYQQLITNRNKLKLDLYNKRFSIYSDTLNFNHELNEENGSTTEMLRKFIDSKEASKFLFSDDPSIYDLLNKIHKESFKVNGYKKISNYPASENKSFDNMHDALIFINNNIPVLQEKLQKYLSFK